MSTTATGVSPPPIDRNAEGTSTDCKRKSAALPEATPPGPKRLRGELYTISPCPSPSPSRSPTSRAETEALKINATESLASPPLVPAARSPPPTVLPPVAVSSRQVVPKRRPARNLKKASTASVDTGILPPPPPSNQIEAPPASATTNVTSPPIQEDPTVFPLPQQLAPARQNKEKSVAFTNPLTSVFGPPSEESTRLQNLNNNGSEKEGKMSKKPTKKGKTVKVPPPKPTEASSRNMAATALRLKRVNTTKSAKNLFYIEYLKTNAVITCKAFEKFWNNLSKEEVKKWTDLAKASRYTLEPVEVDKENVME